MGVGTIYKLEEIEGVEHIYIKNSSTILFVLSLFSDMLSIVKEVVNLLVLGIERYKGIF